MKWTTPLILLLALAAWFGAGCSPQTRDSHELRTSGFIQDNYYQAILEIDADEAAKGLVAKRDSAYLNAKKVNLDDLAADNISQYCVERGIQDGSIIRNKKETNVVQIKSSLLGRVKPLARGGRIIFTYYNEKNSLVIGYRIYNTGFKKKIEDIIKSLDIKNEITPTTRS